MTALKIYLKILVFPLVALVLLGCATKPSNRYSCKTFEPWMSYIKILTKGTDLNRMVSTHRKRERLAELISPAFNDEVFKVSFGKPFRELSKKESEGIWQSMYKCHRTSWVAEVGVSFRSDDLFENRKAMWLGYIEGANKTPFTTIVAKRKNDAAEKKLAVEEAVKRRMRIFYEKKNVDKKKIDWRALGEFIGRLTKYELDAKEGKERRDAQLDQKLEEEGGCLTWFELTDSSTINKVTIHTPGLDYYRLIDLLKEKPWNNAMFNFTEKIKQKYISGGPDITNDLWSSYNDAKSAIWLIQKTPLCRPV